MNPRDRSQRARASERTILYANSFLSDNASFPRLARLAGGAGSARPRERYWLHPGISPLGYQAILNGCGGNEMSRSMCSLATRTHGVRPSEKTASHVISGVSPQGRLTPPNPLRGAGSARPLGRNWPRRGMPHLATRRSFPPDDYVAPRHE